MSLDIYLTEVRPTTVWEANITHNLGTMADAAGLYMVMWHPDEVGVKTASEAIPVLENGLSLLLSDPERFKSLNPSNGWGNYDVLVEFVQAFLSACKEAPNATIEVSR